MIRHATARRMLYDWHSGQTSTFYAAASSGLCASFDALARECATMDNPTDRAKLAAWIEARRRLAPELVVSGRVYRVLPWVSRTYYGCTDGRRV